jgi:hypothetical protein
MKWLTGPIALIVAVGAAVFFWWRNREAANPFVHEAVDSTASWGKAAADKAGEATDNVVGMADKAASAASDISQ